jgi:hypothetical protein
MIAWVGAAYIVPETPPDRVVDRDLVGRVQPIVSTATGEQIDPRIGEDALRDIDRVQDDVGARAAAQDVVPSSADHPVAPTTTSDDVIVVPPVDVVPAPVADEHIGEPRSVEVLDGKEGVVTVIALLPSPSFRGAERPSRSRR